MFCSFQSFESLVLELKLCAGNALMFNPLTMAINFFIPDIGKTGPPDYEYAISFHQKCFVLELFHRKYSVRPPSWNDFHKIIFWVT
jgi:hypothetical protein